MTTITFQSANTIPDEMRKELKAAKTANVAESVFSAWEDRCYVERRSRANVWVECAEY